MSTEEATPDEQGAQPSSSSSWLPTVPAPIKRIFDRFPLITYPPNTLPARSSRPSSDQHVLYIFTDSRASRHGAPSFNPQCLKWQAFLKFSGIKFRTASATNHASPTGSLPFLLPANALIPVSSSKLRKWVAAQTQAPHDAAHENPRFEPYMSLLDHRIRHAWLSTLYLHNRNFTSVARRQYVDSTTSNSLVRATLARELQHSARAELLKGSASVSASTSASPTSAADIAGAYIDVDDILAEANNAFEALSTLLAGDDYFFGASEPGMFDAAVFAYTYLILDPNMGWEEDVLGRYLRRYGNLVQHCQRLTDAYVAQDKS